MELLLFFPRRSSHTYVPFIIRNAQVIRRYVRRSIHLNRK